MKQLPFKLIFVSLILSTILLSCGSEKEETNNTVEKEILDENNSFNTVFDGKIFSIPSPVQTAYLIKQLDLPFDEALLNKSSNVGKYVKEYNQALNLGIYGTDLGQRVALFC